MSSYLFDIGHFFKMDRCASTAFFLLKLVNLVQLSSQNTQALAEEKGFARVCLQLVLESTFRKLSCRQFVLNPESRNSS